MLGFDVFDGDAFSMQTLTDMITHQEYIPGFLGELGLFSEKGINTTKASIREKKGTLSLVSTQSRSAPAPQNEHLKDVLRDFTVPHIPLEDVINSDEFQDVISSSRTDEAALQSLQEEVSDRMSEMNDDLEATTEHLRLGAVRHNILDADGSTVIYNLLTEFEVSAYTPINWDLDNATPASGAVNKLCSQAHRQTADALGRAKYDRLIGLCGHAFFDDLVAHTEVRASYERPKEGDFLRSSFAYRQVTYGDITWIDYRGNVGGTEFVGANDVHHFPLGAPKLFMNWYAPANRLAEVNRKGRPRFAYTVRDIEDRFVKLHMQTNPLPICTKPRACFAGVRT